MAIISSSTALAVRTNPFGGKVKGDDSWLDLLTADVIRAPGKHNGRTVTGVWVSVGAVYGPQVEFKTEALADAFVAAHPETSHRATGTARFRIVADDAVTFVAAYNAAVGGKEVEPKAEEVDQASSWAEFQAWKAWKAAQK